LLTLAKAMLLSRSPKVVESPYQSTFVNTFLSSFAFGGFMEVSPGFIVVLNWVSTIMEQIILGVRVAFTSCSVYVGFVLETSMNLRFDRMTATLY
jgi:hypothetical protein